MKKFTEQYLKNLNYLLKDCDTDAISNIADLLDNTKGKIYIIGNGGSAATASHMVNDLGAGLRRRNIRDFDIQSLSDNTAVCSAISNDIGYKNVFYMQIKNVISPDDVLIAISCSGNSKNITKAVKYAKKQKATIVSLTGFDGGKLKNKSDINFHVQTKSGQYGLVEDMHMIVNHILYSYYIEKAARE